jgi:hypothetical protein
LAEEELNLLPSATFCASVDRNSFMLELSRTQTAPPVAAIRPPIAMLLLSSVSTSSAAEEAETISAMPQHLLPSRTLFHRMLQCCIPSLPPPNTETAPPRDSSPSSLTAFSRAVQSTKVLFCEGGHPLDDDCRGDERLGNDELHQLKRTASVHLNLPLADTQCAPMAREGRSHPA